MIEDIFLDVLDIEINAKDSILDQIVDIVHKFNKDTQGQEKLLQKVERKFENNILENVASRITIDQVELSTIISSMDTTVNNVVALLVNLCDTSNFTLEIKNKLNKVDSDLKTSASQLAVDPTTSLAHFVKPRYLTDLQEKLLR